MDSEKIFPCRTCSNKSKDGLWCDECTNRLRPVDVEYTNYYNDLLSHCAFMGRYDLIEKHLFSYSVIKRDGSNYNVHREEIVRKYRNNYNELVDLLVNANIIYIKDNIIHYKKPS